MTAWLVALISIGSAGPLAGQESGASRDQWYQRGPVTQAPASSAAAMVEQGSQIRQTAVIPVTFVPLTRER